MEGGPYQEYFYIEIPVTAGTSASDVSNGDTSGVEGNDSNSSNSNRVEKGKHRRFVYVQEESATKFPMQFGLEVNILATVLTLCCQFSSFSFRIHNHETLLYTCLSLNLSKTRLPITNRRWLRRFWASLSEATGSTACCRKLRRPPCAMTSAPPSRLSTSPWDSALKCGFLWFCGLSFQYITMH